MKWVHFFKKHFFAGMLVIVPLSVILWILVAVLRIFWSLHEILPVDFRTEYLDHSLFGQVFTFFFAVGASIALLVLISFLGWASKHYLGRKVLEIIGDGIHRIPVIRSVYSALDQLLRTLAAGGGQQFSRVVYLEYPRKGIWTLAFVTGPAKGPAVPERHLNVYVPTTPNPTSGFHLIVSEDEVRESNLKVEDAFKAILSLGIAQPGESNHGSR